MEIKDFLDNFDGECFPHRLGRKMHYHSFDPPFLQKELNQMEKLGIIVNNKKEKFFQLTLKATGHSDALQNQIKQK